MEHRPLKILLMGDYSNCHNTLANALRDRGHDVVVVSDGTGWMKTPKDIDISRKLPGKAGGALLWAKLTASRRRFTGFDIVSINNPTFLNLRPGLNARFFDRLQEGNGAVFLTAMGTDSNYIAEALDPQSELAFNEWRVYGRPSPYALHNPAEAEAWQAEELTAHCRRIYERVKGVTPVLYEYDIAARRLVDTDRIGYIGIPIDVTSLPQAPLPDRIDCLEIMLGRHRNRRLEKGTDILEAAAKSVVETYPGQCRLSIVENMPFDRYLDRLSQCHVLLDQLYSYSPATNALLAMGEGKIAVSGGEDKFYEFIGESDNRPIVNALPDYDRLVATLSDLVERRNELHTLGRQSRLFVEKHNASAVVADRALNFWRRWM